MGIIIAAFAGVGKSYVGQNYKNVLDLDWINYKWIQKQVSNRSEEERKGNKNRVPNPKWPQNYIDEIIKQKENYDIILIPLSHQRLKSEKVFEYFDKHDVEYFIARPNFSGWKNI